MVGVAAVPGPERRGRMAILHVVSPCSRFRTRAVGFRRGASDVSQQRCLDLSADTLMACRECEEMTAVDEKGRQSSTAVETLAAYEGLLATLYPEHRKAFVARRASAPDSALAEGV